MKNYKNQIQNSPIIGYANHKIILDASGNPMDYEFLEVMESLFLFNLDLLCIADLEGNFIKTNEAWNRILGYSREELNQRNFLEFVHPNDMEATLEEIVNLRKCEDILEFTNRYKCKDASYRFLEWRLHLSGNQIYAAARDVTEQKRAEEQAFENNNRLNLAQKVGNVGSWEHDFRTNLVTWSDHTYSIYEEEPNNFEVNFENVIAHFHPDDRDEVIKSLNKSIEEKQNMRIEHRIFTKNGNLRYVLQSGHIIVNEKGEALKIVGSVADITEPKKSETALRASEAIFKTYIESSPLGIFVADFTGKYIDVNKAGEKLVQYSREELLNLTIVDILEPNYIDKGFLIARQAIETGSGDGVVLACRKEGTHFWLSVVVSNVNNEYLLAFCQDVSDRKQSERTIFEQSELQKILITVSNEFINLNLEQTDEIINKALETIGQFTNSDRAYIFDYDHEQMVCNNTYEWCRDGIDSQINKLQGIPFGDVPKWIKNHFAGKTIHISDVMKLPIDSELRQILEPQSIQSILTLPMMDDGKCIGFVGFDSVKSKHVFSDNEQKLLQLFALMLVNVFNRNRIERELIEAKQQAESASKAKTEFLTNMSHEIRTPLNGVIGFTDLLKGTELSSVQQQYVNNANISGHTLMGIINDILDFSKIESGMLHLEKIKIDMIELLESSLDIVKYQSDKKNLELLLCIDPAMPRFAVVDPIRLKQVLANLLGNAVKFTEKGEVELKVNYEEKEVGIGKLSFYVRDTGIGITEEQKNKLFKAFSQADSSTTRKFGGTGLGLIISDLIVNEMGGKILVKSKPGKGSTFHFDIVTKTQEGNILKKNSIEGVKRCLIIDDNANNRIILENMLMKWGVFSESCDNGFAALKLLTNSEAFDLIICDYKMPYLDGLETIRMIQEKLKYNKGKCKIILLHSSLEYPEFHKVCERLGVRLMLTKPVKSSELYAYLSQIQKIDQEKNRQHSNIDSQQKTFLRATFKILIAEDVKINMKLIKALIFKNFPEANIYEAFNGKEAVKLMKEITPDLIFMDIQMPELDGLEATKQIRKLENEKLRNVPIIALTAGAFIEEKQKCMEVGMNDFLAKPVESDKIKAIIENFYHDY